MPYYTGLKGANPLLFAHSCLDVDSWPLMRYERKISHVKFDVVSLIQRLSHTQLLKRPTIQLIVLHTYVHIITLARSFSPTPALAPISLGR